MLRGHNWEKPSPSVDYRSGLLNPGPGDLPLLVLGQDGWGVIYSTQSICVLKGSTVELSCTYKYPSGHKVTSTFWFTTKYTDGNPVNLSDDPDYRGRVRFRIDNKNSHTLIITDLRESDSAEYEFRFITDQSGGRWTGYPGVTLTVTDLQVKMTPATVSEGETVTLTCITSCPLTDNPTYIWYKNEQPVRGDTSSLYVNYISDADSYSCGVKGLENFRSPAVYYLFL
ncbi:uncharacterized protein LOC117594920 [Esox lucius]|uniref:uncharacterized protein LOC117594920 n=1 Tax=Esox lucius TaxID=8010 RepID=UPI0014771A66|nr:uncharacterized protein LOC117594920 [Esox lucius]